MTISPYIDRRQLRFSHITSIGDVGFAQDLLDNLEVDARKIEAQLEFSTEDETEEWEGRAIAALGIKRAQIAAVTRRIAALTGRTANHQARRADKAAAQATHLENQRIALEKEKVRLHIHFNDQRFRVLIASVKARRQFHIDHHYAELAREYLTEDQQREIGQEAKRRAVAAMIEFESMVAGLAVTEFKPGEAA